MWGRLVDLFTSLKLTIVCLAAAMVLIFAGTLAQVHLGIHGNDHGRYFFIIERRQADLPSPTIHIIGVAAPFAGKSDNGDIDLRVIVS